MQEIGPWLIQLVGDTWLAPAEVPISIRDWKVTEGRTGMPEDIVFERRGAAFDALFSESHRTMSLGGGGFSRDLGRAAEF